MRIPAKWFANVVSVQTCTGNGSYGPTYATAATLRADITDKRQLVLNANSEQVLAQRVFRFDGASEPALTPGSLITFDGKVATVITVQRFRRFGQLVFVEAITT
jgi:hypothetical protein